MQSAIRCVSCLVFTAILMSIKTVLADQRVAQGVTLGTAGTGVSLMFDWIPDDIGKLVALIGGAISLVILILHVVLTRTQYRRAVLEIEILHEKEGERIARAEKRMKQ